MSSVLELQASAGLYTHIDGPHSRVPVGRFKIGLIAEERRAHLTNDVAHDPRVSDPSVLVSSVCSSSFGGASRAPRSTLSKFSPPSVGSSASTSS